MKDKKDIESILSQTDTAKGINLREFRSEDFPTIQRIYEKEGWLTVIKRPEDALKAWLNSHPAIVAEYNGEIVGAIRTLSDTEITTYIVELLISEEYRGRGIGRSLLDACHYLYPNTRLEVLATETSEEFYKAYGFRDFHGFRKSYI